MSHPLSKRIGTVLDLDPSAPALQFDGRWSSWGQLAMLARRYIRDLRADALIEMK